MTIGGERSECGEQYKKNMIGGIGMKKALKPCNKPGCPILTREDYCEQHREQHREQSRPMTNTGNQLPNGGITASGGSRALATCPSIRYVPPA